MLQCAWIESGFCLLKDQTKSQLKPPDRLLSLSFSAFEISFFSGECVYYFTREWCFHVQVLPGWLTRTSLKNLTFEQYVYCSCLWTVLTQTLHVLGFRVKLFIWPSMAGIHIMNLFGSFACFVNHLILSIANPVERNRSYHCFTVMVAWYPVSIPSSHSEWYQLEWGFLFHPSVSSLCLHH